MSLPSIMTSLGAILVFHSAYVCLQYRSLLLELDLSETHKLPPIDVYMELGVGFLLCLVGQLLFVGNCIEVTGFGRSLKAPAYRTRDFDIYINRAAVLAKTD